MYGTWKGIGAARLFLLLLIIVGIGLHAFLALSPLGELFGPPFITLSIDGLRVIAVVLLILSPRAYWSQN